MNSADHVWHASRNSNVAHCGADKWQRSGKPITDACWRKVFLAAPDGSRPWRRGNKQIRGESISSIPVAPAVLIHLPISCSHLVSFNLCLQVSKPRQTRDASPSIEKTPAQPAAKTATGSAGNYRSGNCSALDAQQELHLQTWEGRLEKWKAALDKKAAQIEDSKAAAVAISKANEAEQAVCQTPCGQRLHSRDILN